MFIDDCGFIFFSKKEEGRRGRRRFRQALSKVGSHLNTLVMEGWLVWRAAYRLAGLISNLWQQYVSFHASSSFSMFNTNRGHSIYGNHCLQGKKIKKGEIAALTSLASENMF